MWVADPLIRTLPQMEGGLQSRALLLCMYAYRSFFFLSTRGMPVGGEGNSSPPWSYWQGQSRRGMCHAMAGRCGKSKDMRAQGDNITSYPRYTN